MTAAAAAKSSIKPKIPGKPFTGKDAARDSYAHLQKNHGIDPRSASNRLHDIKASAGMGPADDVAIGRTGDVYDTRTNEWIGSLTAGGK